MQNRRFVKPGPARQAPQFKVVVAFDDMAASSSAMRTCDYVVQQLGEDIVVRRKVVDLEDEPDESELAAAARDAANADMVIVSTKEDAQLPAPMRRWLDQWSAQRPQREGALVAILNRDERGLSHSQSVRDQLASLARQANMDFFSSEVVAV